MPRAGFEPTIPASKKAKTVHALVHSSTVTGEDICRVYLLRLFAECQRKWSMKNWKENCRCCTQNRLARRDRERRKKMSHGHLHWNRRKPDIFRNKLESVLDLLSHPYSATHTVPICYSSHYGCTFILLLLYFIYLLSYLFMSVHDKNDIVGKGFYCIMNLEF
jgi:hypothetical protein